MLIRIAVFAVLLAGGLHAHQDTRLEFEDGEITGLPERYQPAAFDREEKVLTIAGKTLRFPDVLHRLFTDDSVRELFGHPISAKGHPYQLNFSASWYHSDLVPELPPYLLIKISPEDRDYSFELLVDMDRLRIIRADVRIAIVGTIPIDLDGVIDSSPQENKTEMATPRKPSD